METRSPAAGADNKTDLWLCVALGVYTMVTHAASFYSGFFNLPELLSANREEAFDKDFYIRPAATALWALGYAFLIFRIARRNARWQGFRNFLAFVAAFAGIVLTFTFYERGAQAGQAARLLAAHSVLEIAKPRPIATMKKQPGYLTITDGIIDTPNTLSGEYRTAGTGRDSRGRGGISGSDEQFILLPIVNDAEDAAEIVTTFLFIDHGTADGRPAYKHRVRGYVRKFKADGKGKFESLEETFDGDWQAKDRGIAKVLSDYSGTLPETVIILDNRLLQDGGPLGVKTLAIRFGFLAVLTLLLILLQWLTRIGTHR